MNDGFDIDGFDRACDALIEREGGFVDDPADLGGATKYGISLRFLRAQGTQLGLADIDADGDVDADDIRTLSANDARDIYRHAFWNRYRYHELPKRVRGKMLDLAVNMGPMQAHRILQRALCACAFRFVKEDGILGPQTLGAAHGAIPDCLICALRAEAAGVYRLIVKTNPPLTRFLRGWLTRAYT